VSEPLRVAMLTYSVRPRGGVVHAIAVAEALARRGHHVELFAVGPPGAAFFRAPRVPAHVVDNRADEPDFDAKIAATIEAYRDGLRPLLRDGDFDVVHAQDCISANAALALRDEGVVDAVVRTVHHVDDFRSPSLVACQIRSIAEPDRVLCVSPPWVDRVRDEFGVEAGLVGNGVDAERYRPPRDAAERAAARAAFDLDGRLAILTVGGIEPRKGSLTLLDAFAVARDALADRRPVLLIAGGATLFDYRDEVDRFHARAAELRVDADLRVLGPVSDAELEALYRAADVFALPSAKEGFGLAVLEALAAGLPAVVSDLDVFRGFLDDGASALLAPAGDADALAGALVRIARDPTLADRLRAGGRAVVRRHTWGRVAEAHEAAYGAFLAGRLAGRAR
jgi:glycosyltransferase-like protein